MSGIGSLAYKMHRWEVRRPVIRDKAPGRGRGIMEPLPPKQMGQPIEPVQPVQYGQYEPYGQPVKPVQPVEPVQPVVPVQPVDPEAPVSGADRARQAVYLIFGIIEVLIALRIVLKLLAANPSAGFSSFIYGITEPLVGPFLGVFNTPSGNNGSVFELSSVLAIIVYMLLAYVIVRVIYILSRRPTATV